MGLTGDPTPLRLAVAESMTPRLSFAEDLALYRSVGFTGIGIHARAKLDDPDAGLAAFRASGLEAAVCMTRLGHALPTAQSPSPATIAERVVAMQKGIAELAPFNPACCVCGPGGYAARDGGWSAAVAALREVVVFAGTLGMTVAVEPLHPSIQQDWTSLRSFADALRLCEEIGEPNVGVLADVWHLWDGPNFLEELEANIARVVAVQIDDWRDPTRGTFDRVLPGDGIADVPAILGVLKRARFGGWIELEVMSDDGTFGTNYPDSVWHRDPREVLVESKTRVEQMWRDA